MDCILTRFETRAAVVGARRPVEGVLVVRGFDVCITRFCGRNRLARHQPLNRCEALLQFGFLCGRESTGRTHAFYTTPDRVGEAAACQWRAVFVGADADTGAAYIRGTRAATLL